MPSTEKNNFQIRSNKSKHKGKPTSFWMQDPETVFKELQLKKGDCFLDIGCGVGDYTVYASKNVGDSGVVYALDQAEKLINDLKLKAGTLGLNNIKAKVADITKQLPIEDNSVDACLIATVLHAIDFKTNGKTLFKEIYRVLKPSGRLITIDCKKEDDSFGPPMNMRLSPIEVETYAAQFGLHKVNFINLGFNYLIQFAT